jgi:hypothetical protein
LFRVRGEHAHAWDEIYLAGFGWVIMDPTPGRAPPRAEQWLGVPEQQDAPGGDGTVAITPPVAGDGDIDGTAGLGVDEPRDPDANLDRLSTTSGAAGDNDNGGLPTPVRRTGQAIAATIALYLLAVPATLGLKAAVRRRRASTPGAKVRLAWAGTLGAATAAGLRLPASLTVAEAADRLAAELPSAASAVRTVAGHVERVVYAEVTLSPADVDAAVGASAISAAELRARHPLYRRVARYFDIRELWRDRSPRQRLSSGGHFTASARVPIR